jgi:putative ABC transport system permease protein
MSDVAFLIRYALRSLLRGGQRSLLAITCIAFGVLSLVALQLLAHTVNRSTAVPPRLAMGGDLRIARSDGSLTEADRTLLDSLTRSGDLDAVTYLARGETGLLRSTRSGLVQFVGRSIAVDPATYPLAGRLRLAGGGSAADALSQDGSVVVTRDLALRLGVVTGDTLRYGGELQRSAVLVVGGVGEAMPDRRGQTMLYSFETARRVLDDARPGWASATARQDSAVAARLRSAGFTVTRAVEQGPDRTARLFGTMLRGAGLLGLIIGGIGVGYTLQVMLTRRRLEIATLRTLGYRTNRLLLLFGVEAGVLGLIGGVAGTILAVALSAQLVRLLDRTAGALMLEHGIAWHAVGAGPLLGVTTAVLFGMAAIVRAAGVRPAVLMRDLPVRAPRRAAVGSAGLYALLTLLFTGVASVVMGSVVGGLAVVALAIVGTLLLGIVLTSLLWLLVRVPLPGLPLVNMARANLRSRQIRSAFSLIALFAGTFAIGFAATAMMSGSARVAERRGSDEGLNLRVFVGAGDEAHAVDALHALGARRVLTSASMDLETVTHGSGSLRMLTRADVLDRNTIGELVDIAEGAALDEEAGGVLVHWWIAQQTSVGVGDSIVVGIGDRTVLLTVVGTYRPHEDDFFAAPRGLVVAPVTAAQLGAEARPSLLADVDPRALATAAEVLGRRLPASMVLSRREMNDFLVSQYQSLFTFVVAVAALALLAGAVLIANSVALAMVERRRELGVLKAVGFTSRRVLRTILLENAGLGLVAGITGVAAVHVVSAVLNVRNPGIDLQLGAGPGVLLVAISMLLAMAAAGLVAWGPVHVRPLEVLRDE